MDGIEWYTYWRTDKVQEFLVNQLGEDEKDVISIAKQKVAKLEQHIVVALSEQDAAHKQCNVAESERDA